MVRSLNKVKALSPKASTNDFFSLLLLTGHSGNVIEKNPNLDVEELLEKINPKQKLLKEKLLSRLLWGSITGFIGLGLLIGSVFACYAGGWTGDEINFMWITGAISLAIGIAFMITYYVGRKMLAKEMEAETRKMEQK